jgi:hypothetical protein
LDPVVDLAGWSRPPGDQLSPLMACSSGDIPAQHNRKPDPFAAIPEGSGMAPQRDRVTLWFDVRAKERGR